MNPEKVVHLVNEALEENESLFLIDMAISSSNKITVIVDGDAGVPLNECIRISRHVENNLDREEEDYALEVTTPDITEPLKSFRQYKKNVGRTMRVKTEEGTREGILQKFDKESIVILQTSREPKPVGKGKITVEREITIPIEEIIEAKVKIII
jgi:ribosome maturation factor RimP